MQTTEQTIEITKVKAQPRATVKQQLIDLEINSDDCLQVPGARCGTVYSVINTLKKEGYNFKTQKINGVMHVWRIDA